LKESPPILHALQYLSVILRGLNIPPLAHLLQLAVLQVLGQFVGKLRQRRKPERNERGGGAGGQKAEVTAVHSGCPLKREAGRQGTESQANVNEARRAEGRWKAVSSFGLLHRRRRPRAVGDFDLGPT